MINDMYIGGKPDNIHFTSLGGGIPKNWLDFPKQFNFWLISVFFEEKKTTNIFVHARNRCLTSHRHMREDNLARS